MKLTTEGKRSTEWQIQENQEADVQCQMPWESNLPLLKEQFLDQTETVHAGYVDPSETAIVWQPPFKFWVNELELDHVDRKRS